ncbi:MAG: hypothetical protein ACRDYX_17540 [Egibacteraceae bacterium]
MDRRTANSRPLGGSKSGYLRGLQHTRAVSESGQLLTDRAPAPAQQVTIISRAIGWYRRSSGALASALSSAQNVA